MEHLQKAFLLAKTAAEKQVLQKKIDRLRGSGGLC